MKIQEYACAKTFLRVLLVAACLSGFYADLQGQSAGSPAPAPEVLLMNQAVALALRDNRGLKNAALEVSKADQQVAAERTRRLPTFHLDAAFSQELVPIDFLFEKGVFGDFPFIGPVPAKDTDISTPLKPTTIFDARVSQPLTQLYRVHLEIAQARLGRELAQEQLREQRHEIAQSVKQAYSAVLQTQSGLESANQDVSLYRELDRITSGFVQQDVALRGDSLEVKVRLAKAEYQVSVLGDQLVTQKQQLNRLLGRDPLTEFSVNVVPEGTENETDLAAMRKSALERRPEVREARLKIEQADEDRRLKKSEYIPEASLSLQYLTLRNFRDFLPKDIASVGVTVNWEVFDWGRKKHELNEKELTVEESKNGLRDAQTEVLIDLDDKFRKLQRSRQLLRISELSQQSATENVRVMQNRYREQASLIREVLQAQSALEQANYEYQQALASVWTSQAEFEKAAGED